MAAEWYLMNTDHDTVSGFESDDFDLLAQDMFDEALNSAIGINVEICNFDLSERTGARVIVQGNTQETKLNSLVRRMLAPIGTCKSGQYVFYKNRYWLIIGLVDDNGLYEKAVMALCDYLLTWKNRSGQIIQRWVCAESASQYNNGEFNDRYIYIRNDQLLIYLPDDDECLLVPHGTRFIMDKRCKIYEREYDANVTVDTSKELLTYELTRMDNVIFNYQDCGYVQFLVSQDEKHPDDGYYVVDNVGYWLCEEPEEANDKTGVLLCRINCNEPIVYNGLEATVFTAYFSDSEGNEITVTPEWEITSDFSNELNTSFVDNTISISVDNRRLVNKSFELSLCASGYEKASTTVLIKAFS